MDSGKSWLVLIASFCSFMINLGMIVSFGVYFVTLLETFHCSRADAALVGSVAYGASCLCGPLAAVLYRTVGSQITVMSGGVLASFGYILSYFAGSVRHLVATQGIVGFGYGICITSLLSVQTEYFKKYRFFAVSFVTVGSALGLFVFPPLFVFLIDSYTWRGSMLINAGISLQTVVFGAILRPNREQRTVEQNSVDNKTNKCSRYFELSLFKDFRYVLLCFECLLWGGYVYIYYAMINALMKESDISKEESAILVSISGACNCFGRIGASVLAHRKRTNRPLLYACATLLFSSQIWTSVFCESSVAFGLSAAFFGLGFGLMLATLATVVVEVFGVEKLPSAQGFLAFCVGIGGLTMPFAAGELADKYGMKAAFIFAGVCSIVGTISCFLIVFHQSFCVKESPNEEILEQELECATPMPAD